MRWSQDAFQNSWPYTPISYCKHSGRRQCHLLLQSMSAYTCIPMRMKLMCWPQLEEDSKQGKLGGIARLGKRTFATPEFSAGEGIEPLRRLTWRVVYANWCYYISYTVLQRFAVSQIAINGFVVCIRKHSVFQQVNWLLC